MLLLIAYLFVVVCVGVDLLLEPCERYPVVTTAHLSKGRHHGLSEHPQ